MRWWLTMGDLQSDDGCIVELTWARSGLSATEVLRYRAPADRRVWGKGFTGGEFGRDGFFVPDFNSVYKIDATGRIDLLFTRPDFNDLHHIAWNAESLWVTNTGLDRIDVFTADGCFLGGKALAPSVEEYERRGQPGQIGSYFREDASLPFHRRRVQDGVHPNHVGVWQGVPVVTTLLDRTLRRLDDFTTVVTTPGHPHDGIEYDGLFWITCTDGRVFAYEHAYGSIHVRHRLDLFASTGQVGWCRGLWVGATMLLVGLTRMAFAPNTNWPARPFEQTRTAVLAVDRENGSLLDVLDLAAYGAHPKLFSIVRVPEWFR